MESENLNSLIWTENRHSKDVSFIGTFVYNKGIYPEKVDMKNTGVS